MSKDMLNVISLGGGKQSSYMLLRALEGDFQYRPDFAVFADTQCEPQYVYDFLDWLIPYVKEKYNFKVVVVSKGNLKQDVVDYVDRKTKRVSQLPFFLGGNAGMVNRQCTADYKIAPIRQHLQKVRNGKGIRLWIGISLDEIERMKTSPVKYVQHYYPLVESRIAIDNIISFFHDHPDMPTPGKSACLICPFHSFAYWQVFKNNFKNEFSEACEFDNKIRKYPKLRHDAYLSNRRKPLSEIDFNFNNSLFPDLIEECHGLCGL